MNRYAISILSIIVFPFYFSSIHCSKNEPPVKEGMLAGAVAIGVVTVGRMVVMEAGRAAIIEAPKAVVYVAKEAANWTCWGFGQVKNALLSINKKDVEDTAEKLAFCASVGAAGVGTFAKMVLRSSASSQIPKDGVEKMQKSCSGGRPANKGVNNQKEQASEPSFVSNNTSLSSEQECVDHEETVVQKLSNQEQYCPKRSDYEDSNTYNEYMDFIERAERFQESEEQKFKHSPDNADVMNEGIVAALAEKQAHYNASESKNNKNDHDACERERKETTLVEQMDDTGGFSVPFSPEYTKLEMAKNIKNDAQQLAAVKKVMARLVLSTNMDTKSDIEIKREIEERFNRYLHEQAPEVRTRIQNYLDTATEDELKKYGINVSSLRKIFSYNLDDMVPEEDGDSLRERALNFAAVAGSTFVGTYAIAGVLHIKTAEYAISYIKKQLQESQTEEKEIYDELFKLMDELEYKNSNDSDYQLKNAAYQELLIRRDKFEEKMASMFAYFYTIYGPFPGVEETNNLYRQYGRLYDLSKSGDSYWKNKYEEAGRAFEQFAKRNSAC